MPGGIGPLELAIVLLIVLVLVGGRRLPALGRQLGTGMREFKDSVTRKVDEDQDDDEPEPRALGRPDTADAPPVDGEVVRDRR
ncbi:MAG TPA: twin-arginine translocase TatA/TatE family subunit [Solirubrobacteraceae bacterium]|nr:twin-arginine translocase TatA/TatE family subunit [Solirubrobacteraceae bacterium]